MDMNRWYPSSLTEVKRIENIIIFSNQPILVTLGEQLIFLRTNENLMTRQNKHESFHCLVHRLPLT